MTKEVKNIFIADKIADDGIEYLKQISGFNVTLKPGLNEDELCKALVDQHALIIRSGVTITAKVLEAAKKMEVIGRAGIGVDNIDINKATELGVAILNTPNANATTTAELAIAHMFSISRSLPQADKSVRAGEWKRSEFMGAEIANKKLGIVGYGTIGRLVAERAKALKMKVHAFDPFVTEEAFAKDGVTPCTVDELVSICDYITLHCPVTDKTRNVISRERIEKMKKGARIINCARGGLVDEDALYEALESGHLAGAALDVYNQEPPKDSPLFTLSNIVFTPHLGASTREAQTAAGTEIAQQIATYLQTGEPVNAINLPRVSAEVLKSMQPYLTLSNRLGQLVSGMIEDPVTQVEVTAYGDIAKMDTRALTTECLIGLLGKQMSVPVNRVNVSHIAAQKGIKVTEVISDEQKDYQSVLSVKVTHGNNVTTVSGTVFDKKWPRLTMINDYEIEVALSDNILFTRHLDQPGVLATICSLLADKDINISRMQLGIVPDSNKALAAICISELLDSDSIETLLSVEPINKVMQLQLA